jgi:ElaB/YqjD/DUF883 family membrane-anchored ribosome-binding protein
MNRYEPTTNAGNNAGRAAEKAVDSAVSGLESTMRNAAAQAEKAADAVTRQGREAAEGISDVATNFADALDESLRNRPMSTLALAAVAGFVLGALWKS